MGTSTSIASITPMPGTVSPASIASLYIIGLMKKEHVITALTYCGLNNLEIVEFFDTNETARARHYKMYPYDLNEEVQAYKGVDISGNPTITLMRVSDSYHTGEYGV